ncbi:serine/threonine protein kinase [Streptomyces armeniacus]|uniref:non-specific serine/threonine protein kinase n=1 Tax=Streptomyces armeniacus TaxID=83291 RepID=A0A345XRC8_9ACTN|nr:serine/threonine-protein kinase [Streptomyces armeniacus]AXK34194.1 serine/threonine protein kinase [Streptomyces armeniacus]
MTGRSDGRVVDERFELLERLGGGGMGLVWRARDLALHREVALKEVRPPDPELLRLRPDAAEMLRKRVMREAVSLARISHPNVVTIYHIVDSAAMEHPWLVMELVPGGSFADRLDRSPCTPTEAAQLGRGVLAALRAAHAEGILHRDVKPGNVLLRADGTAVLTDFGIAAVRESTNLTNTGELIGSPDYMAPERLRGRDDDPSSDLWSLAMMLYVAVEGYHPMQRASTLATLAAILEEEVPDPRQAGRLGPVLRAVLTKDIAARPEAEELDRLLAEAAGERAVTVLSAGAAPAAQAPPVTASPPVTETAPPDPRSALTAGPAEAPAEAASEGPPAAEPEPAEAEAGTEAGAEVGADAEAGADAPETSAAKPAPVAPEPAKPDDAEPAVPEPDTRPPGGGPPQPGDAETGRTPAPRRPLSGRMRRWRVLPALLAVAVGALAWQFKPSLGIGDGEGDRPSANPSATGPSPDASEEPSAEPSADEKGVEDGNLLTPSGIRKVIDEMEPVMGGTEVINFDVYPEHASAAAPVKGKDVYDNYGYRDGKAEHEGAGALMEGRPTMDLDDFNWDAVPRLIRVAETELGVRNPKRDSMYLLLSHDSTDGPQMRLYVSGDYSTSGSVSANPKGKITDRYEAT